MTALLLIYIAVKVSAGPCVPSSIAGCSHPDTGNSLGVSNTTSCGCLGCFGGYHKVSSYSCFACTNLDANCWGCNTSLCIYCKTGFSFNTARVCTTCASLINGFGCAECNLITPPYLCVTCLWTYFFNVNNFCEPCLDYLPNCLTCAN
jgi:hypothetical protein